MRNTHATGKSRTWSEIGAMAIDPLTGYNRIRTGDWGRVADTPPDRVRTLADAFQKALATDTWKTFRERTQSVDLFLGPAEFRAFLAAEEARFVPLVDELGLRKK